MPLKPMNDIERKKIADILKVLGSETRLQIIQVIMNSHHKIMTTTEISKELISITGNTRFNTAIISKEIGILKNKHILKDSQQWNGNRWVYKYYRVDISIESLLEYALILYRLKEARYEQN